MSTKPSIKLSVSVPQAVVVGARRHAGRRGLSSFIARAMEHELAREALGSYLAELNERHGPVREEDLEAARRAWRGR